MFGLFKRVKEIREKLRIEYILNKEELDKSPLNKILVVTH